jgi:hypothetical protein
LLQSEKLKPSEELNPLEENMALSKELEPTKELKPLVEMLAFTELKKPLFNELFQVMVVVEELSSAPVRMRVPRPDGRT